MKNRTDKERIDWLESMHTLHQDVEITYAVDSYIVEICWDGEPLPNKQFQGENLRDAIDLAMQAEE